MNSRSGLHSLVITSALAVAPAESPATAPLKHLVNSIAAYALVAAVAAVLIGGLGWALGTRLGFDSASVAGRNSVVAGLALAFLVGSTTALVNYLLATGQSIPQPGSSAGGPPVAATPLDGNPSEGALPAPPEDEIQIANLRVRATEHGRQKDIVDDGPTTYIYSGKADWILDFDSTGRIPDGYGLFLLNWNTDPSNHWSNGRSNQPYKPGTTPEWYVQIEIPQPRTSPVSVPLREGKDGEYIRCRPRFATIVLATGTTLDLLREKIARGDSNKMIPTYNWQVLDRIPVWKKENESQREDPRC